MTPGGASRKEAKNGKGHGNLNNEREQRLLSSETVSCACSNDNAHKNGSNQKLITGVLGVCVLLDRSREVGSFLVKPANIGLRGGREVRGE
jgi:hypothetical protein